MATFGDRLKILRTENHLTQEELANNFFLNKSSISKYEKNLQLPENNLLREIAKFFDVSLDYLLAISDDRNIITMNKLSSHERAALLIDAKLVEDGYELTESDVNDIVLAAKIVLEQKRHQDK
ncbi:XRE family transcriptional regulator [human gut metagenome]|uniref:XRE family transcriptional regulator n=1 Tax=human gut metagenome TaxID=408170 RepID=W1WKF9_9ZZZZ|nr:helix-turn-helix transcriptional regulator [Clostridium sp.]MDU1114848.1 helix-turn-helix transcriptional regulator [Clostridium sp.]MDU7712390.1 helix-turn-helix transcriptional regulator [Clostridium butyricum]